MCSLSVNQRRVFSARQLLCDSHAALNCLERRADISSKSLIFPHKPVLPTFLEMPTHNGEKAIGECSFLRVPFQLFLTCGILNVDPCCWLAQRGTGCRRERSFAGMVSLSVKYVGLGCWCIALRALVTRSLGLL